MHGTTYYVRIMGREMGPFSLAQLQQMKGRGQIRGFHEISADRLTWQSASTLTALFPNAGIVTAPTAAAPAAPPPRPTVVAQPRRRSKVPLVVAIAAPVLALLVGGAVVGVGIWIGVRRSGAHVFEAKEVVHFDDRTDAAERHRMLKHAVGFIVCGIHVVRADGSQVELPLSSGSGFAVTADGYVLTNRHVIENIDNALRSDMVLIGHREEVRDGKRVQVPDYLAYKDLEKQRKCKITPTVWAFFSRNEKHRAEIRYISTYYDLAVLKIDRSTRHYLALSSKPTEALVPDLAVVACGFPGIQETIVKEAKGDDVTKSGAGPVEGKFPDEVFAPNQESGRITTEPYEYGGSRLLRNPKCLQHTADIFHGNSGGPLLLADGTVVGINTYGFTAREGRETKKVNLSITMLQLRDEIDRNVPGVVWR